LGNKGYFMRASFLTAPFAAAAFMVCAFTAAEAGVLVPLPAVPGSVSTYVEAVNNHNLIAGNYKTQDGKLRGFVGTMGGNYTTFDALSGNTGVRGLNDDGYITRIFCSSNAGLPVLRLRVSAQA
jgi:hypothetical protein